MKKIPVKQLHPGDERGSEGRFSIRALESLLRGKDLLQDLHRHDFFFILLLEKARGWHEIDFVKYPLRDKMVFLLRPGQVHRLHIQAGSRGYLAEFDLSFYHPKQNLTELRWQKAISRNHCRVDTKRFEKLRRLLLQMMEEFKTRPEGHEAAIRAGLDLFFLEYIRQSAAPGVKKEAASGYVQDRYAELMQLLEQHIRSHRTVRAYAQWMNLSPYQLNAIVKAATGKTVSALINDQVILEAKRELLATGKQVKELADELGFEDDSYFIRFFRKHTGFAPATFRRNFR